MSFQYIVGQGLKAVPGGDGAQSFTWTINGVVELPNEKVIASPRHVTRAFDIANAKVSAKVAGTAEYTITVRSYDDEGDNMIEHINDVVILNDRGIFDLVIDIPSVGTDRFLELSLQSENGTFVEDLTVTIGE